MRNLKICIADDHTLYRDAVIKLLQDFKRTGKVSEASNGKELLKLMRNEAPDVVILDLEMPVLDGMRTCEKIVKEFPEVKIIVVSMHDSKALIYRLLEIGAHAFLSKTAEAAEFEAAIYAVVDKGIYRNKIMQDALKASAKMSYKMSVIKTKVELSDREHAIVQLLAKGFTNKQIGKELSLSENTIRNHRVRIMRKTGARNAADLMKQVFQNFFGRSK
jgi:DNA-binding NarL/FixJ family response regulator